MEFKRLEILGRGGVPVGHVDLIATGPSEGEYKIVIQLQNEDHTAVVQEWKLLRARIIKHTSGPLNAKGTDVAMEELVVAYERLEMA